MKCGFKCKLIIQNMLKRGLTFKGNKNDHHLGGNHLKQPSSKESQTSQITPGFKDGSSAEHLPPLQSHQNPIRHQYSRQLVMTKSDSIKDQFCECLTMMMCRRQKNSNNNSTLALYLNEIRQQRDQSENITLKNEWIVIKRITIIMNCLIEIYFLAGIAYEHFRIRYNLDDFVSTDNGCKSVFGFTFSLLGDSQNDNSKNTINTLTALAWIRPMVLIAHIILNILQYSKDSFFMKLHRHNSQISILFAMVFSHLQMQITIEYYSLFVCGQFMLLPLIIIGQGSKDTIYSTAFLFILSHIYPIILIIKFLNEMNKICETQFLSNFQDFVGPVIFLHFAGMITVMLSIKNLQGSLIQERHNIDLMRTEYDEILEKMPEGILIISKDGDIKFMNIELRDVLNLQYADSNEEKMGLEHKMFKRYNLVDELSSPVEDEEQEITFESLNNIIAAQGWKAEEDKFYELQLLGVVPEKDEDRVFTQIRKTNVRFHEQEATLLLIRNITHIINYEKAKNVGKYQELLTGTMSHEMLTPLNTIINISQFIELKISQIIINNQAAKEEQLKIINLSKQHLQLYYGNGTLTENQQEKLLQKNNQNSDTSDSESDSDTEQLNSSPGSKTDEKRIPEYLLAQQRKLILQNSNQQEKSLSDSLDYMHMVKSSAVILQFLVKELIDLNNIKQNKFTTNFQGHDQQSLMDSCQEIIDCYKVQAREKNIFLRLCRTSRVFLRDFEIYFDKQRFQQILINLVQNAVKFTSVGGVEIITEIDQGNTIRAVQNSSQSQFSNSGPGQIQSFLNQQDSGYRGLLSGSMQQQLAHCDSCGFILTRVKDTGVGMKKEVVDNLFKLFALVQSNSVKKGIITTQGIGLGLSVNKQVVEKLGGRIKINTTPGQGTEVIFTIPYKCRMCANTDSHLPAPPISQQNNLMVIPTQNLYINRGRQQSIYRNRTQVEFSFAGEKTGSKRGSRNSIKSAQKQVNQKQKSKQPFGGDYQSIYGSCQQNESQTIEQQNSRYLTMLNQSKVQNSVNCGQGSENHGFESPFGQTGLQSFLIQTNNDRSARSHLNNSSDSLRETEQSLNLSQNYNYLKKKTGIAERIHSQNISIHSPHSTKPLNSMVQPPTMQQFRQNQQLQHGFTLMSQKKPLSRNYSVKESNRFEHTLEKISQRNIQEKNRQDFITLHSKSMGLKNNQVNEEQSRSLRENEFDPVSDMMKFKAKGRSATGVSIQILHPLSPEGQASSGIGYLSINDEVQNGTREIFNQKFVKYIINKKANDLKELGRTDSCSLLPTTTKNDAHQEAYQSVSDIKLDLNHQNITLGERPIVEGEDSSDTPVSPGFRETQRSLIKERSDMINSGEANHLIINAPILLSSKNESDQQNTNNNLIHSQSQQSSFLKKQNSALKKLRFEDAPIEEEKQIIFSKIMEDCDQENANSGRISKKGNGNKNIISISYHEKEGSNQNADFEVSNNNILNVPLQYQNESFGNSASTTYQQLAINRHQVSLKNDQNLKPESQHNQSYERKSRRQSSSSNTPKSRLNFKKSSNSNQRSKKVSGISSNEMSQNQEQQDAPSPMMQNNRYRINPAQNIMAANQIPLIDRGRTSLGFNPQNMGSLPLRNNFDLNICHCYDNNDRDQPTILIVDDNMFNIIPLELVLKEFCGLKCDKALNGEEAVNMFKKNLQSASANISPRQGSGERCANCGHQIQPQQKVPTYKMVFMDIQMPIMDGYEATRQILQLYSKWKISSRVTDKDHNLKVVAITSFTNDEAIKTAYESGMVQVLNKPVDKNQIKAALDKYYYSQNSVGDANSKKQFSAMSNVFPGGF